MLIYMVLIYYRDLNEISAGKLFLANSKEDIKIIIINEIFCKNFFKSLFFSSAFAENKFQ